MRDVGGQTRISWAAFAGPLAWGVSTLLNSVIAASLCGDAARWIIAGTTAALASISLYAGAESLRYFKEYATGLDLEHSRSFQPLLLISGIGVALGSLFGSVIALQGVAALFFQGCVS
ncbi:MAG: hypothetical protein JWR75_1437 [Devosia sp.]|nr:hypothetical protein [Devosia sp.]